MKQSLLFVTDNSNNLCFLFSIIFQKISSELHVVFWAICFPKSWESRGLFWLNPVSHKDQRAALRLWLALLPCDPNPASFVHQRLDSGVCTCGWCPAVDPWSWLCIWISPWWNVEFCLDYSTTSTNLLFNCNEASMQKFVYIIGLWLWAREDNWTVGWRPSAEIRLISPDGRQPATSIQLLTLLQFLSPIWMKLIVYIQ